jgi:hypothetical protein
MEIYSFVPHFKGALKGFASKSCSTIVPSMSIPKKLTT